MRTYDIAQGIVLNALWWPEWEGSPKGGAICTCVTDSFCYAVETNTTL